MKNKNLMILKRACSDLSGLKKDERKLKRYLIKSASLQLLMEKLAFTPVKRWGMWGKAKNWLGRTFGYQDSYNEWVKQHIFDKNNNVTRDSLWGARDSLENIPFRYRSAALQALRDYENEWNDDVASTKHMLDDVYNRDADNRLRMYEDRARGASEAAEALERERYGNRGLYGGRGGLGLYGSGRMPGYDPHISPFLRGTYAIRRGYSPYPGGGYPPYGYGPMMGYGGPGMMISHQAARMMVDRPYSPMSRAYRRMLRSGEFDMPMGMYGSWFGYPMIGPGGYPAPGPSYPYMLTSAPSFGSPDEAVKAYGLDVKSMDTNPSMGGATAITTTDGKRYCFMNGQLRNVSSDGIMADVASLPASASTPSSAPTTTSSTSVGGSATPPPTASGIC